MRTRSVVQLHTANKLQIIGWPLITMCMALVIVIAIGYAVNQVDGGNGVPGMEEGMRFNGAIFTVLGPVVGLGFISMGQYFPLSLGLGLTRREYLAGTSLVFVGYAVAFTALVVVGRALELATDGYGLRVRFFDVVYVGTGPLWQTAIQAALIALAVMFVGAAFVAAHSNWQQKFVWSFVIAAAAIVAALAIAAIVSPTFADWLDGLFGLAWWQYMAMLAVIAAFGAAIWAVLVRRTQVR
jgi:hypothetical protein